MVNRPQTPPKMTPLKGGAIGGAALAMIAGVIAIEGGYVNHPSDPGGETNMGITKQVAVQNGYRGPMRTLPRSVAESIYYEKYLVAPGYANLIPIDAAVTEELFDTTVNMGPARPARWFRQSINELCGESLPTTGPVTRSVIVTYELCQDGKGSARLCREMLDSLDAKQKAEYGRLVRVNPRLKVFYKGWVNHRIGNVSRAKCTGGK